MSRARKGQKGFRTGACVCVCERDKVCVLVCLCEYVHICVGGGGSDGTLVGKFWKEILERLPRLSRVLIGYRWNVLVFISRFHQRRRSAPTASLLTEAASSWKMTGTRWWGVITRKCSRLGCGDRFCSRPYSECDVYAFAKHLFCQQNAEGANTSTSLSLFRPLSSLLCYFWTEPSQAVSIGGLSLGLLHYRAVTWLKYPKFSSAPIVVITQLKVSSRCESFIVLNVFHWLISGE